MKHTLRLRNWEDKTMLECLAVKNLSQMKWGVFVAVIFINDHMALLGKLAGHARVPYGTLGSERVNDTTFRK